MSETKIHDPFTLVGQVGGLVGSYLKVREQVAELERQITILNEDARRYQKMIKDLNEQLAAKG